MTSPIPSPLAPTLMVQGTSSSVGKSLLVTALCRLYARRGCRVAPFKSQNMALNAGVTADGLEIGRAQLAQAQAAGVEARVEMNPVLLKPEGQAVSQLVVLGRPQGSFPAAVYQSRKEGLKGVVADSLATLRREYELVFIEGAGSPAEINLKAQDIVNMHVARLARSPVLLAGDIDRGGVFAHLAGTLDLLEPEERALVAGLVINKFRGDPALLAPGLEFIRQRTGKPVAGVLPWLDGVRLAQEDSQGVEEQPQRQPGPGLLEVAVVRYPRMANFDDLDPLAAEPDVALRFVTQPRQALEAHLLVLPGSKATLADLDWLREQGWEPLIQRRAAEGRPMLAICGGCQMLGGAIHNPHRLEGGQQNGQGLGLLPLETRFGLDKTTRRVAGRLLGGGWLGAAANPPPLVEGYLMHHGQVSRTGGQPLLRLEKGIQGGPVQGMEGLEGVASGAIAATMVHGLLDSPTARHALLAPLRALAGLPQRPPSRFSRLDEYDRLADWAEAHLDIKLIDRLLGL